nr:10427_t:CDS:2 [Entrophospora candida]CAG8609199.1 10143_t:CDS:2 [Entrophospora candida]
MYISEQTPFKNWSLLKCLEYLETRSLDLRTSDKELIQSDFKHHVHSLMNHQAEADRVLESEEITTIFRRIDTRALEESKRELLAVKKSLFDTEVQLTIEDYKIQTTSSSINLNDSLIDLRPNSKFTRKLPLDILNPYLKELDDRIENLIPLNVHNFLTKFFNQNLTDSGWNNMIDDLQCSDKNDHLMVSTVRILRKTLPTLTKKSTFKFGQISIGIRGGSRPNEKDDKEIADASKISDNLQKIFLNIAKDNIKYSSLVTGNCKSSSDWIIFADRLNGLSVIVESDDKVENAKLPRLAQTSSLYWIKWINGLMDIIRRPQPTNKKDKGKAFILENM